MEKNIILIGFMGVGKGSTARDFAKTYGIYNIDTDDLIESKTNKEIKRIFKKYGEEYFRALEQETADWIEANVKGTLISCGGGFYKVHNIKKLGTIVLLDAPFEWIFDRLKNAKNAKEKIAKRPLFTKIKEAKKLYEQRVGEYKKVADVIVSVDKMSQEEIIKEIAKLREIK
jgi:shikimate kinase